MDSKEKAKNAVSPLTDPFKKDCIYWISIEIHRPTTWRKSVEVTVRFQNGSTHGHQKIEGDELPSVMQEVQAFIDNLEQPE